MTEARPLTYQDLVGADDALDEFGPIATQDRIDASLKPTVVRQAPGSLTPRKINEITKARVRALCTDIVAGEMPRVRAALEALAADNPKVYLDQLMAFMEFSLPKLKAMELDVSDNRENARTMGLAELEQAFMNSVVSNQ